MFGPDFKPDEKICTYLTIITRPRKGHSDFVCVCSEETTASCMKDGDCLIYPEMLKKIKSLRSESLTKVGDFDE